MIAIVDFGQEDVPPLERALADVGAKGEVVQSPDRLKRAAKVVLSCSGAYSAAARQIRDRSLISTLLRAMAEGVPYLGVGLGMQLLFDVIYEGGQHTGLGVIPGKVIPFDVDTNHPVRRQFKVPHVGWTPVHWNDDCPLLSGLKSGDSFYFDHSTHAQPLDERVTIGRSGYGFDFSAVIWRGNLYGTQFLPHRSQENGSKVLANFAAA